MTTRQKQSPGYFKAIAHEVFIQSPAARGRPDNGPADKNAGQPIVQPPEDPVRHAAAAKLLRLIELTNEKWAAIAPTYAPRLWILIDLYVQEQRGKQVSVTNACLAAGVPCTSALRAIDHLMDEDMLRRYPDRNDARRKFLSLTDRSRAMISAYIDQFIATLGI